MAKNYIYAIVLIVVLGIVVLGVYWAFFLQPAKLKDIVETAADDGSFTTLVTALEAANLVDTLKGTGPFTVFAPTDDAFNALPSGVLDDLLANVTALTEVLTYHVVSGKYMAADVVTLSALTTVQGDDLTIDVTDTTVKIDGATVVQTDIETSNGVIHVIDIVVVPGGVLDIVQTAEYAGSFTTLVTALEAADLVDTLKGTGPFTVFAPTDDAFNALPSGVLDDLLANVTALTEVLTYHVVSGKYMAADVVTLSALTTVQGGNLTISATDGVQIDGANVVQTDIACRNGVIHVIDAVLIP
jgi:transforming growth factor-beta-induced protein